ncbi:P-loop containing nucleoside triphosphate hydrolase protein [Aspergillus spectabilis]
MEQFLGTAECEILHSEESQTSLRDAQIAWPIEGNHDSSPDGRFILGGLDIQFPQGGLSVIAGRTATGKNSLLAAILRECDVLHGALRVPSSPTPGERLDQRANSVNWILDSAMAYLVQNPWMENASIQQSILFGLPYNAQQYRQATLAAALDQDWAVLPDGDQTEIGTNGVDLSGGQKWRVSLGLAFLC